MIHSTTIENTMTQVVTTPTMVTSVIPTNICQTATKSYTISYDILIQLCTVMAIVYTNEGNRKRRLGDLCTAKQHYQMAIRLHRFVHQALQLQDDE
jgi:hypothetical protein